jgi:hypothetical protein
MANLKSFVFTNQNDSAVSLDGWTVASQGFLVYDTVHALAGNDLIRATSGRDGILVQGVLDLGDGNDVISGTGLESVSQTRANAGIYLEGG